LGSVSDREFWTAIVRALWIVMDAICQRHGVNIQAALERRMRG
jgi:hypothetical protein